jgi:hypothetical protein
MYICCPFSASTASVGRLGASVLSIWCATHVTWSEQAQSPHGTSSILGDFGVSL